MKVTEVPEQMELAEAEIDILTGRFGFIVAVTGVLEAEGHPLFVAST